MLLLFLQYIASAPPSSMCHRPSFTQYRWPANSHLPASRDKNCVSPEPRSTQKSSLSHPLLYILGFTCFPFYSKKQIQATNSPRTVTKTERQSLGNVIPECSRIHFPSLPLLRKHATAESFSSLRYPWDF